MLKKSIVVVHAAHRAPFGAAWLTRLGPDLSCPESVSFVRFEKTLNRDVSTFHPQCDVPRQNDHHRRMVEYCPEPADVRNWLRDRVESRILIGVQNVDRNIDRHPLPWSPWPSGGKISGGILLLADHERFKGIRDPRGIKATARREFSRTLNTVGFTSTGHATTGSRERMRLVPAIDAVAERLVAGLRGDASEH